MYDVIHACCNGLSVATPGATAAAAAAALHSVVCFSKERAFLNQGRWAFSILRCAPQSQQCTLSLRDSHDSQVFLSCLMGVDQDASVGSVADASFGVDQRHQCQQRDSTRSNQIGDRPHAYKEEDIHVLRVRRQYRIHRLPARLPRVGTTPKARCLMWCTSIS